MVQGDDRAGFHDGELAVQTRADVLEEAQRLVGMLAPPDLRGGASRFLAERSFLALTSRDDADLLWTTQLSGPRGFLEVHDASTLHVHALPVSADPLHGLAAGRSVGMLAIDFATRRRMRVNGVLTVAGPDGLTMPVQEAYGNCPQYIQQRDLKPGTGQVRTRDDAEHRGAELTDASVNLIRGADTFMLGTTHPVRGLDASHRGGPPGSCASAPALGQVVGWGSCRGRTTPGTTCSTVSATWPWTTRPRCCSWSSPVLTRCP